MTETTTKAIVDRYWATHPRVAARVSLAAGLHPRTGAKSPLRYLADCTELLGRIVLKFQAIPRRPVTVCTAARDGAILKVRDASVDGFPVIVACETGIHWSKPEFMRMTVDVEYLACITYLTYEDQPRLIDFSRPSHPTMFEIPSSLNCHWAIDRHTCGLVTDEACLIMESDGSVVRSLPCDATARGWGWNYGYAGKRVDVYPGCCFEYDGHSIARIPSTEGIPYPGGRFLGQYSPPHVRLPGASVDITLPCAFETRYVTEVGMTLQTSCTKETHRSLVVGTLPTAKAPTPMPPTSFPFPRSGCVAYMFNDLIAITWDTGVMWIRRTSRGGLHAATTRFLEVSSRFLKVSSFRVVRAMDKKSRSALVMTNHGNYSVDTTTGEIFARWESGCCRDPSKIACIQSHATLDS